jgi:hypothetical protein
VGPTALTWLRTRREVGHIIELVAVLALTPGLTESTVVQRKTVSPNPFYDLEQSPPVSPPSRTATTPWRSRSALVRARDR